MTLMTPVFQPSEHRREHRQRRDDRGADEALAEAVVVVVADRADEHALDRGVQHDERHADRLLQGDREAEAQRQQHPAEHHRQAQGGGLVADDPGRTGAGQQDHEQAHRLHHDVVEGDPTGLDRPGGAALVQLLQLARRHGVLHARAARRSRSPPTAEAGIAALVHLLVEPVEHRVARHLCLQHVGPLRERSCHEVKGAGSRESSRPVTVVMGDVAADGFGGGRAPSGRMAGRRRTGRARGARQRCNGGAPDGFRTRTVAILSRLPLPLGYGDRRQVTDRSGAGGCRGDRRPGRGRAGPRVWSISCCSATASKASVAISTHSPVTGS